MVNGVMCMCTKVIKNSIGWVSFRELCCSAGLVDTLGHRVRGMLYVV